MSIAGIPPAPQSRVELPDAVASSEDPLVPLAAAMFPFVGGQVRGAAGDAQKLSHADGHRYAEKARQAAADDFGAALWREQPAGGADGRADRFYPPRAGGALQSRHHDVRGGDEAGQALAGGDLEGGFIDAQTEFVHLVEKQLNEDLAALQSRNFQVQKLSAAIDGLNKALAQFPGDAKSSDKLDGTDGWKKDPALEREVNTALVEAGIHPGLHLDGPPAATNLKNSDGNPITLPGGVRGSATKAELEALSAKIKGMLDSAGNQTQLDMVRIQARMGKVGEATTLLSNLIKKLNDVMSSVISNIR